MENIPSIGELLAAGFETATVNTVGDCLFESFSVLNYGRLDHHLTIRGKIIDFMVRRKYYQIFFMVPTFKFYGISIYSFRLYHKIMNNTVHVRS